MDDQADQLVKNMEKDQSVSMETSDLAPSKPSKLYLKLKISKTSKRCGQHICPVCSKGFSSGKALGGHIRIHMKGNKNGRLRKISKLRQPSNIQHPKAKKRISKDTGLPTAAAALDRAVDEVDDDSALNPQEEGNNNYNNNNTEEKAICCICNKDFRSMKSLFGHMRNHPERSWRGIRPPPSNKNSCCSSVSENDEAMEVVDQISATEGSDLLKSLPKWSNTNITAKRCGKFISDEIPEAAFCLLKLSRGESFHFDASSANKLMMINKSRSSSLASKASEEKKRSGPADGKGKDRMIKIELDQERVPSDHRKRADSYWSGEEKVIMMGKSLAKELNYDNFIDRKTMTREKRTKLMNNGDQDANKVVEKNRWFNQFQKLPMKPDEEKGDASAMEGRHRGSKKNGPSSQTPSFYTKNPSSEGLFAAPSNETAAAPEGKHLHSKKRLPKNQIPAKRPSHHDQAAAEGSHHQVCTTKLLDFDLNEPYVALDAEATGF